MPKLLPPKGKKYVSDKKGGAKLLLFTLPPNCCPRDQLQTGRKPLVHVGFLAPLLGAFWQFPFGDNLRTGKEDTGGNLAIVNWGRWFFFQPLQKVTIGDRGNTVEASYTRSVKIFLSYKTIKHTLIFIEVIGHKMERVILVLHVNFSYSDDFKNKCWNNNGNFELIKSHFKFAR